MRAHRGFDGGSRTWSVDNYLLLGWFAVKRLEPTFITAGRVDRSQI
jgi:hypothetical protein